MWGVPTAPTAPRVVTRERRPQPVPIVNNCLQRGEVTVRVPRVLLKCKVSAITAVILMVIGTVIHRPEIRAWALLIAILAAGLGICHGIRSATQAVKAYVQRWSVETFEHGMKQGIEMGREMEAAERLIASTREGDEWRTSGN